MSTPNADAVTLSFSEKRDWLRLTRTTSIGPVAFQGLIERFGNASNALEALPELANRSSRHRQNLKIPSLSQIEQEMSAMDERGIELLCSCESKFPPYLRAIAPPPPTISVLGNASLLHRPCLAIIGSRNASANGLRFARQIAHELGQQGYCIVSGLALGMDASAHWGAIESGTAAVLGGGVDHVYPRQNSDLYAQIAQKGVLVSESPLGMRATARDFPRRNRIISGLSLGVIVIEAAEKSGTLITARYAMEQNREVMAAPGSPLDPRTKGCNRLIQQGASLIESSDDVLNIIETLSIDIVSEQNHPYDPQTIFEPSAELTPQNLLPQNHVQQNLAQQNDQTDLDHAKRVLLSLCSTTPTIRDEIIRQSEIPYPVAASALLELEICRKIFAEADGRLSILL